MDTTRNQGSEGKMTLEQRNREWWITGVPDTVTECGPYDTRAEAADDMRGLARFFKYADRPGFVTCDRPDNAKK